MMMTHVQLPDRFAGEATEIAFAGTQFTLGFDRDEGGRIVEVLIRGCGLGSAIDTAARDAGILINLGLQQGVTLYAMRHAVTRDSNGSPSSFVGAVLDELVDKCSLEIEKWLALRKDEALKINAEDAEIMWVRGQALDPYEVFGITIHSPYHFWVELCFVRRPESDIWVYAEDLPEKVRRELEERIKVDPPRPDDSLPWE